MVPYSGMNGLADMSRRSYSTPSASAVVGTGYGVESGAAACSSLSIYYSLGIAMPTKLNIMTAGAMSKYDKILMLRSVFVPRLLWIFY